MLREAGSIAGVDDWQEIEPDRHDDWIGQRDETFETFYAVGSKEAKSGQTDNAVFRMFVNGYYSARDSYVYNFSYPLCADNARKMVDNYLGALNELNKTSNPP